MHVLTMLRRTRPFLLLGAVATAAFLVGLTWEKYTYYDDGGVGTISFLLVFTVGLPFVLPAQLVAYLGRELGPWFGYIAWSIGLLVGVLFYFGLDKLVALYTKGADAKRGATI